MNQIPQFLIAAPSSGTGKTTIARGLMGLLRRHGYHVQPFKCGPDYIDTKFHASMCGRPSVNLDAFMASEHHLQEVYTHYAKDAEVCVVEGMMGLFDGYDRDKGSCSEVARILSLPIILVVDAKSAAYSLAPLLKGFLQFSDQIRIIGVIFNRVGSSRHMSMLRQVCDDVRVECLGFLPTNKELVQTSRYLGLDFSQEDHSTELLVDEMEKHIEWQRLLELTMTERPEWMGNSLFRFPFAERLKPADNKIWVARNEESFSFIYQEHLDILRRYGEVRFFNPEENQPIPLDLDLLYLPGGYPEKHLDTLFAANQTRQSLLEFAELGGNVIAECGGMMYLCQSIVHEDGEVQMVGFLPYKVSIRQKERKMSLGYRQLTIDGKRLHGHEFHYSQFIGDIPTSAVQVYNAKGDSVSSPFIKKKNVWASYTHLYWGL